ncbi:MAG: hypothetical protein EP343_27785 [Deltaproteobacteria bacterium]|nr:MAG: hypothetical protein EP343_27785 [Deltaproteobacteria bacterium]
MTTSPETTTSPSPPARKPWYTSDWLPLFLLLVGVVLVYGQVITFSFVNWDDTSYVYRNPELLYPERFTWWQRWFPKRFGYPIPLTMLSYRIDQWFYQVPLPNQNNVLKGQGFHLTNLLIWMVLLGVLYRFCLHLVRSRWAALGGTALFAFHPTSVETVAWVTGRKELLVALFGLAATYSMVLLFQQATWKRWSWLMLWSMLAFLAKPNAVFLVPLFLWWVLFRPKPHAKEVDPEQSSQPPSRVMLLLYGGFVVASSLVLVVISSRWQAKLGALEGQRSLVEILDRAVWALGYHLKLLLFPVQLRIKYIVGPDGFDLYHLFGLVAITWSLVVLLHPRTRRSLWSLATVLAISAYLPSSNLLPLRRYISDTYLFVPMLGGALWAALVLRFLAQQWKTALAYRAITLASGGLLLTLAVLSTLQVQVWRDPVSLWQHSYRYHPNSPKLCRMLGMSYNEVANNREAVKTYLHCSKKFGPRLYRHNLGLTYGMLKMWDKAAEQYKAILEQNPNNRRAHYFLQMIKMEKKRASQRGRPRHEH